MLISGFAIADTPASELAEAQVGTLLDAARRESGDLDTVAAIVGEASQDLRFNQQVLQADGEDEQAAIDAAAALFERRFDEDS